MRQLAKAAARRQDRRNKTEAAFEANWLQPRYLAREFQWTGFEALKLRLGHNTHYTPDFSAVRTDDQAIVHFECKPVGTKGAYAGKAYSREDARVKVKLAAQLFPFMLFYVVACGRRRGVWSYTFEEINPH